jgi:hypothetical protein
MLSYLLLSVEGKMKDIVKKELQRFEVTVNDVKEGKGKFNIIAKVVTDNNVRLNAFILEQLNKLNGIIQIEKIVI